MLRWAVKQADRPVAIRYPRGSEGKYQGCAFEADPADLCIHREGTDVTIVTYGTILNNVLAAADQLAEKGISAKVIRLLSPTHYAGLPQQAVGPVFVVEEVASRSGITEELAGCLTDHRVRGIDLGSSFVPHGDQASLYKHTGLDAGSITKFVCEVLTP